MGLGDPGRWLGGGAVSATGLARANAGVTCDVTEGPCACGAWHATAPVPLERDRLAMEGVRHGIAWERRTVLFLIDCAIHHAKGRPDAVEALESLKVSVEAYA